MHYRGDDLYPKCTSPVNIKIPESLSLQWKYSPEETGGVNLTMSSTCWHNVIGESIKEVSNKKCEVF